MGTTRLSDTINRKFIETYPVTNKQVLTHNGYKNIKFINKTIVYEVWEIVLENGMKLKSADDHIVITHDFREVFVKDCIGKTLNTIKGPSKVIEVINTKESDNMYDIEVDSDDNLYYSNGILSHNTLSVRIFIMWSVLFGKDINFGIAANKEDQAKEVLDGIKLAYMALPLWMQQGVKKWNAKSIYLENGGVIKISATSATAFRGMSFAASYEFKTIDGKDMRISSGIYVDECAFIEKNKWEAFRNSVIPTVSSGKYGRVVYTSTPHGMNHFYKIWTEAINTKNGFKPTFIPYWEHPERDEKWAEDKRKELGNDVAFEQEYGCVMGNTNLTIKIGKEIKDISIENLFNFLNNNIRDI